MDIGILLTPCWHDYATKTVGPTTDQINWHCPVCKATRTTWPNRHALLAAEVEYASWTVPAGVGGTHEG